MFTLNEIDPLSYGKIQAVMWLIAGLVLGVIGSLLILALGPSVVRFLSNRYANAISGYSLASLARLIPAFAVLLPVIGILGGALIGFLAGVIIGFLYNFSASKVGGVKLDLTKDRRTLAHVEPMSYAKVLAIMIGVFGAISGALVGAVSGSLGGGALSLLGLIAGALLGIIIGAIFGFIIGLIYAALYDIIAERFGGIRIELSKDTKQLNRIDVISYAKVLAIFGKKRREKSKDDVDFIAEMINKYDGVGYASGVAKEYMERAKVAMEKNSGTMPENEYKKLMLSAISELFTRKK